MDAHSNLDLGVFWRRLRPFARREWGRYTIGGVFEILTLGTTIVYPQLIRIIVDQGIEAGATERIHQLVLVMAGVLIVQALAGYVRTFLFELAALRASVAIQKWIFGNLIVQEIAFFDRENAGEMSSRLSNDVAKLTFALANVIPEAIHFGLMGLVAGALMVYTSPLLSLVVVLVAPVIWGGTTVAGRVLRKQTQRFQDAWAQTNLAGLEAFSSIHAVRVYHQERAEIDRFTARSERMVEAARKQARAHGVLRSFTDLLSEGAVVLALWVGGTLIVGGTLTAGLLVTFLLYAAMVMRSLRNASNIFAGIMSAQGASERIFELGERESRMPLEGGERPSSVRGEIRLEGVHFVYPTRPDSAALRGIDLVIPRGELLAIVGASGSGKSTITKLIARLYDPDRGRVLLDGRDIRELDPAFLREQITLVPAEATLFARSVADNIRYGRPDAEAEVVRQAARVANANEFVSELPEQYDTDAGDRGQLFSSGQRQRIGIARAVVRAPKVLLLDEATAALDSEGEALVKQALRALPHRPTIVLVSHRLSTVVDADRVVMVCDGRIEASGTHAELLAGCEPYRTLVETQLLG